MQFWSENQGQSPLYAKFGTITGRNYSHNCHDRLQATHYPSYYGEQKDQGRESSYWTVPGSRREGSLQEFATWMDLELPAPAPSPFPFILDRHAQRRQDLGEYHSRHDARDTRDWTAAQRPSRDHERRFLRDGWQTRWEPCDAARFSREVSNKRSDNSYRELEAWAARYCHSLPRRRRLEAESRGSSQGLIDSSRAPEGDGRIGTDPQVASLQQLRQSANSRESGVWDTGGRLPTPTHHPSQAPAPDTSHTLDIKDKTGYQMRMFSQPPGYSAPPPYSSPHKGSPVMHHSWEQESKRQAYRPQPTLRNNAPVEPQRKSKGEKMNCTKPDGTKTRAELDGVKHRRQETDAPASVQTAAVQRDSLLSPQQPPAIKSVQNTAEQKSSKIIEGRKFRLNKKTGGMTIFCLVSRIAGVTDTPSLPLCISETSLESTASGELSKVPQHSDDSRTNPGDEVDFTAPDLIEQSDDANVTNVKQKETQTHTASETPGERRSKSEEMSSVSPEQNYLTFANSSPGREPKLPVPVKYPLWREPAGFTSGAEARSLSPFSLKSHSEASEPDGPLSQEERAQVYPSDGTEDTESESSEGLLVIDTTCVVVKMELIPSPKKEHVHYLGCTAEAEISSPCMATSSASETLEQRALRILGIPLYDFVTENAPPSLGSCPEERDDEAERSPPALPDAVGQSSEEEQVQHHWGLGRAEAATCVEGDNNARDQVTNADSGDFAGCQEPQCNKPEQSDTAMAGDDRVESAGGGSKTEQSVEGSLTVLVHLSKASAEEGLDPKVAELDIAENIPPHPETSASPTPLEHLPPRLSHAATPLTDRSPSPPPPPPPLPLIISQTQEATPVITLSTDGKDEPSQRVENEFDGAPENLELISEQQPESDQLDDPATHVNILQLELKCVKAEDGDCAKQSHVAVRQLQTGLKSPPVFLETKTQQDNVVDSRTRREDHRDKKEEDAPCENESCVNEEQPQTDVGEDPAGLLEPKISQASTTDCRPHAETNILQYTEPQPNPPGSALEASQSPLEVLSRPKLPSAPRVSHKPGPGSNLEMDSVSPSDLNDAAADGTVAETVPPLELDRNEEFSSSTPSDLASNLVLSCTPPSQEGGQSVSPDLPQIDEPQYSMSLWDAVNRIRKHTAPDSDDEEEEVIELWDPESLGEDLSCPDVAEDRSSRNVPFDVAEHQDISAKASLEDREVGLIQQPSGQSEEDTQSCSSTSSRSSGDTVIVAEEDQALETTLAAEAGRNTETDQEFHTAEGERRVPRKSEDDKTTDEGDAGERRKGRDTNVFRVSEECAAGVEKATAEITEVMATAQRKPVGDILTPSEVAEVSEEVKG